MELLEQRKEREDKRDMRDAERYQRLMTANELRGDGTNRRLSVGFMCDVCKCSRPLRTPLCHPSGDYFAVGTAYEHEKRNGEIEQRLEVPGIRSWKGFSPANFVEGAVQPKDKDEDPVEERNRQLDDDVVAVQKVPDWCLEVVPKEFKPWVEAGMLHFHELFTDPMWHKDQI